MKVSHYFLPTLKETPQDASLASHRLMLRAGLIRALASGLYTWLPLGLRVLRKVEAIVRAEMGAAGALEINMPVVEPGDLWQETGRWDKYGKELLKIQDRHERDFCLGPTHEEVIVDLARRELNSYKQLPVAFYQIGTKFRDEIRPRFGVMRGREFVMKDAYSFHIDGVSLEQTYQAMKQAYHNIFTRLGLDFRAVDADTGAIGGDRSQEFQVLAEAGEDIIAYCEDSDYAANIEKAQSLAPLEGASSPSPLEKFATPGLKSIESLASAMGIPATVSIKTLLVKGEEAPLVALILRGDHELNALKAEKLDGVLAPLQMAEEAEARSTLGASFGSLGVVGLQIPMVVDRDAAVLGNFVCGANEDGFHYKNVNWGRDVELGTVADIRNVVEGDRSPDGKGTLKFARGIEVGHIFQNGEEYTKPMKCDVLGEDGKAQTLLTGCYGIGISRVVAAAIEQHHDDAGIKWPLAMAPFQVVILPMNRHKSYRVQEASDKLYEELKAAGIDVLLDDRKIRPGIMFNEMDLLGIPYRVVIGEKGIDAGEYEVKARSSEQAEQVPVANVVSHLLQSVAC